MISYFIKQISSSPDDDTKVSVNVLNRSVSSDVSVTKYPVRTEIDRFNQSHVVSFSIRLLLPSSGPSLSSRCELSFCLQRPFWPVWILIEPVDLGASWSSPLHSDPLLHSSFPRHTYLSLLMFLFILFYFLFLSNCPVPQFSISSLFPCWLAFSLCFLTLPFHHVNMHTIVSVLFSSGPLHVCLVPFDKTDLLDGDERQAVLWDWQQDVNDIKALGSWTTSVSLGWEMVGWMFCTFLLF